jgi:dihydroflavonol-4-reductase
MNPLNVTVTGASGHLGNVLVRELVSRGHAVTALVLPGDDLRSLRGLPIKRVEGDVTDAATLPAAVQGADWVFHLAGVVSISTLNANVVQRVNVEGTRNVVAACRAAGVRRFVYTSSVHALTEPGPGARLDESAGFDSTRAIGAYGRSKAEASLAVLEAARSGLDAVLVLPTAVIGPFDYRPSEVGDLFRLFARRRLPAIVDGGYDFVDVRDIARGHLLAAERGRRGESYLLTGRYLPVREVLRVVGQEAGRRPPRLVLPLPAAAALAVFAPAWERLTGRRALLTSYSVHTISRRHSICDEKARRELGFQSMPIEHSLRDAWRWMTTDSESPLLRSAPAAGPARVPRS